MTVQLIRCPEHGSVQADYYWDADLQLEGDGLQRGYWCFAGEHEVTGWFCPKCGSPVSPTDPGLCCGMLL